MDQQLEKVDVIDRHKWIFKHFSKLLTNVPFIGTVKHVNHFL